MRRFIVPILATVVGFSCRFDAEPELPPVEERVSVATQDLTDLLTAPANGWRLDYQPVTDGAQFLIIMEYNEDGTLRIQSDVTTADGEFRDDTISYRIDARQGLELILETYGVFHFLSENVGGGFEFLYVNEVDGNLVFRTKSGPTTPTLVFAPAGPDDADQISTEAIPNLARGVFQDPQLAGPLAIYNIYLPAQNHTISGIFDLESRQIQIEGIGTGRTQDEILAANSRTSINRRTSFSIANEVLILDNPISVTHEGSQYSLSQLPVENLQELTDSFCVGTTDSVARFNSQGVSGLGDFVMTSSLFMTHSTFVDLPENPYNANSTAVFDENDESTGEEVAELFPDAIAIQWYQGFELGDGTVLDAFGVLSVNALNQASFYLREFDYVREGNIMNITWTDFLIVKQDGTDVTDQDRDNLASWTDEVFEGGQVYMIEALTIEDALEFYNACNDYKGFVFR